MRGVSDRSVSGIKPGSSDGQALETQEGAGSFMRRERIAGAESRRPGEGAPFETRKRKAPYGHEAPWQLCTELPANWSASHIDRSPGSSAPDPFRSPAAHPPPWK